MASGPLKDQWLRELSERFEERFIVIDRGIMDSLYGENPWEREAQIITSIDFAKREVIPPSIRSEPERGYKDLCQLQGLAFARAWRFKSSSGHT